MTFRADVSYRERLLVSSLLLAGLTLLIAGCDSITGTDDETEDSSENTAPEISWLDDPTILNGEVTIDWNGTDEESGSERLRYEYSVTGPEEKAGTTRDTVLTFTGLPSGSYRFKVRAHDPDGGESEWAHSAFAVSLFSAPQQISSVTRRRGELTAGDVDRDGQIDIVTPVSWYRQVAGGFGSAEKFSDDLGTGSKVFVRNLDGDESAEVVTYAYYHPLSERCILRFDYTGSGFELKETISCGNFLAAAIDVGGNGLVDLITANHDSSKVWIRRNEGEGRYDDRTVLEWGSNYPGTAWPTVRAVTDMDNDGDEDLVLGARQNSSEPGDEFRVAWSENQADGLGKPKRIHVC